MADKITPNTNKITLKHPFKFEGETLKSLTLKDRLKGGDLLAVEAEMKAKGIVNSTEVERNMFMAARAIGQPIEYVEEMDLADYVVLADKTSGFL